MKSDWEKQRDRNIKKIQKAIAELHKMGYIIEADTVETMIGTEMTHIYMKCRMGSTNRIVEQKHLFSLDNQPPQYTPTAKMVKGG